MANWNEANYDWKKPMIAARKLGLFHQFFISVELYHNYTKQYTNGKSFLWVRNNFLWLDIYRKKCKKSRKESLAEGLRVRGGSRGNQTVKEKAGGRAEGSRIEGIKKHELEV